MQTRLGRIARRARSHRGEVFTNLFGHLDEELLTVSFGELKRERVPGVDGVTAEQYAEQLRENIERLVERLHRGSYRPQPAQRARIPKGNGKERLLGIPTTEDKLVQRALSRILEQVYEQDFYAFSHGFRPGRSCHGALKELSRTIGTKKVNWVVEADIKGFFDNVDHAWMLKMVAHRVGDPRVLHLIGRFLGAGAMEDGRRLETEVGTPQGGVISPLLANIYLHYVLDDWFARVVKRHCRGEAYLLRYADDFVACFQYEEDARQFHAALSKRLGKFGLEVEPSKTRMFEFGRFARRDAERRGESKAAVFDFLGLTHQCGTSRRGRFKLKWQTAKSRYRSKLRAMKEWIRANRILPLRKVFEAVNAKLNGHYQYFAVSDNWQRLWRFREATKRLLYRWLNRRSQRRSFTPQAFDEYLKRFPLAEPKRIVVNLNSAFV